MKKGFTLIELLAVIVILTIISLIAVPIVLNIINNSRTNSYIRSAELYSDNIQNKVASKITTDTEFNPTSCTVKSDGTATCQGITLDIVRSKTSPKSGNIILSNGQIQNGSTLVFDTTTLKYENHKWVIQNNVVAISEPTPYYIDVITGKKCNNYNKSNSTVGYNGVTPSLGQTSCLKFYKIGQSNNKIDLILDHNTTIHSDWISISDYNIANTDNTYCGYSSCNDEGPVTALKQLKVDTDNWSDTFIRTDSYKDPFTGKVTSYNGLKARLVSADEIIATVRKGYTLNDIDKWQSEAATYWQENTENLEALSSEESQYIDLVKTVESEGYLISYSFWWDSREAIQNDTISNKINTNRWYWTSTSDPDDTSSAYDVDFMGMLTGGDIFGTPSYGGGEGIRPVISISSKVIE